MTPEFKRLRDQADATRKAARDAEENLRVAINRCKHDWTQPKYDPKHTPGGSWEASGGGSDYRPAGSYGPTTTPRWSKTCTICGEVRYTERSEPVVSSQRPIFND